MKNTICLISLTVIFLSFFSTANAQDDVEQLKRVLQGPINNAFHRWDDEWSVDEYIDESAVISYFSESEYSTDQLWANGSFKVSRPWMGTIKIQFRAKFSITDSGIYFQQLCYTDGSVEDEDCTDPSSYGLGFFGF